MAILVNLHKERETKGTVVYTDDEEDGIKSIYLPKRVIAKLGNPARITLTLEASE